MNLRNDHNKIYYTQYKHQDIKSSSIANSKVGEKADDEILNQSDDRSTIDRQIIDAEEMIDRGFSGEGWRDPPNKS